MKTYVYIAQSIDGFIAKPDGSLDWLEHDSQGEDYGFSNFMKNIDVLVMGSNTFRSIMNFEEWHYDNKKVVILSSSLDIKEVPDILKDKIEISKLSPIEVLKEFEQKGFKNIYIDGGKLIQSFLREQSIDELIITQIPILLGEGISLFGNLNKEIKLELIKSQSFKSGLVQLNYNVLY